MSWKGWPESQGEEVFIYADASLFGPYACVASVATDEDGLAINTESRVLSSARYNDITDAEYQGIRYALEHAKHLGAKRVTVFCDCHGAVVWFNKGEVPEERAQSMAIVTHIMRGVARSFESITVVQIPRCLNKAHDAAYGAAKAISGACGIRGPVICSEDVAAVTAEEVAEEAHRATAAALIRKV